MIVRLPVKVLVLLLARLDVLVVEVDVMQLAEVRAKDVKQIAKKLVDMLAQLVVINAQEIVAGQRVKLDVEIPVTLDASLSVLNNVEIHVV